MRRLMVPLLALAIANCMTTSGHDAQGPNRPPTAGNIALSLDMGGIRMVNEVTGSTRPIAFGLPAQNVKAAVDQLLGQSGRDSRAEDCDGVYGGVLLETSYDRDGLQIFVDPQTNRFVGWNLGRNGLSTMNGVSVGTTRSELERVDTFEMVNDSTLEHEFVIGAGREDSIGGVFDGPGPNARIATLWSGTVCQHR